jgi:hypothetical protein
LEWDDERSGSLDALKEYNTALPNTTFFLGFITTKNAIVETEEFITFENDKYFIFYSFYFCCVYIYMKN